MVAASAGANSFKIGLLVFEILHNKYFRIQYFNLNPIEMVVSVMYGKTFSDHVLEKIFKIGEAIQKL